MASRVHGFGRREAIEEEVVQDVETVSLLNKPALVDKAILNEAVELTLENADPRHADSMRRLWAMDQDSDAAKAYFADQVRARVQANFAEMSRRELVINEVLTQDESAALSDYAREFNLSFRNSVGNEHGFFSARRVVDHKILMSKFPAGYPFLDFGGSVQYHVRNGNKQAIAVSPFDIDSKDPTRMTLTRLALRKLLNADDASEVTREMARSVLAREGVYHRDETVQTTKAQAMVSVAVHVYDVPLVEWPKMMERCGVRVHEGCIHFINDFFEKDEGEFPFSGARYEIDRAKDLFRMRVGHSSAMWYTHKWSDLMCYGANQILHTDTGKYSYQIVERRQDTIFYRILRVDSSAASNRKQVYALPSVPMVEVDGFEVFPENKRAGAASRKQLVRRAYQFPQALWERMLTYATAELDRGGLSYDKMFNYYRTVVPRQTINSVHVSGGQKVPLTEVPALVVMAAVVAYSDALLMQRTIRARTDQIQADRLLASEGTIFKMFRTFVDGVVGIGLLPFSPLAAVGTKITEVYLKLMKERLVTWCPQVRLRSLNVALLVDQKQLSYDVAMPGQIDYASTVDTDAVARMVELSRADVDVARDLLASCGDSLSPKVRERLVSTIGTETLVPSSVGSSVDCGASAKAVSVPGVRWVQRGEKKLRVTTYSAVDVKRSVKNKRLAIEEALAECIADSKDLTFTCQRICREILVNGKPRERVLRDRAEEFYNPDLWFVRNGVLTHSILNPSGVTAFPYSGVFLPVPDEDGNQLHSVRDEQYEGLSSGTGKAVAREHYVLPIKYTGYAMVIDGLKVFNGPAVAEQLSRALEMDDDCYNFRVICHQGPPGCGKTTTIAREGDVDHDLFLAPTRMAKNGLSDRLRKNFGIDARQAWLICRTLDSFLVNYTHLPDAAKQAFDRMVIDEYVLSRAGKWYAAAVLAGVSEIHAYGDNHQITHKPRVQVPKFYLNMQPDVLEEEFVGYRNCAVILAGYNFDYNNEVRTASEYIGKFVRVKTMSEVQWLKDCRLLSMFQADKKLLNETADRLGSDRPIVSTVHEGQGSDCDQVVLYNGEFRKRSAEDSFYLYGLVDYCLVAISRARKEVYYVKMSDEPDMITQMIDRSRDVRRVEACKDLATQGTNNLSYL